MEKYKLTSKLFKTLMHPARLAILDILRESEHCVCHLESQLGFRQAYISQQLAILRDAGLVQDRRDGWNIFYHVVAPEVFELFDKAVEMSTKDLYIEPTIHAQRSTKKPCSCPKCNPPSKTKELLVHSTGQEE